MKYYISLFAILLFISCGEKLDFNNSQFYDVEDILTSRNCTADCEETADCENQIVKMIGTIDESNISLMNRNFFMVDRSEAQVDMEVRVDSTAAPEVFALITDKGGFDARITGRLQGEDGTGSNCARVIYMTIDDESAIVIIE
jgi:hypothetical protein